MSGSLSLNGPWGLIYSETEADYYCAEHFHREPPFTARVPSPVHRTMLEAGIIDDLNVGMNTLKARWIEEVWWVYRRTFTAPPAAAEQPATLTFQRLEMNATVWLNGVEVGSHANANRPAAFDVTGKIRSGQNLIVVRVEAGLMGAVDRRAEGYAYDWHARLTKRHWDRKPQFQAGWDWNPRLMNVGILGDVTLEWSAAPRLTDVAVFAVPADDLASARFVVRATAVNPAAEPADAILRMRVGEGEAAAEQPLTLAPGETRLELSAPLANPRLWWPLGHGEQALYSVEGELECAGEKAAFSRRTGVRRVEMDQSPHPVEGRHCTLKINDRPIFCKGGNWVPADMLYSETTPERLRALVQLAVDANFNLLRVWGGGLFAQPALCEACDEMGVLLWHDFLFACAKYPGDDPRFTAEVRAEITWAVRAMAHHPSLVVWCGNNEVEWGDWAWGYDNSQPTHPHYHIFHHDIPKIVRAEDPTTLHWISSPWSPDQGEPNDPTVGDQHPWRVSIMEPGGADFHLYRTFVDRFPNEGGVLGATSPATLRQFLPPGEQAVMSPSWRHHDNPFAQTSERPGGVGRAYRTVRLWLDQCPLSKSFDDYVFASALLQAEGLQEYISNYRRRMFSSASAIFWMYNDSWPVTHGWTIVDYYLRRKLAFHPVRRAFQPVTVVAAAEGDLITLWGVNDTPAEWRGDLRWGLFSTTGGLALDRTAPALLPANAFVPLAAIPLAELNDRGAGGTGAFGVLSQAGRPTAQHRLLLSRFGEMEWAAPEVTLRRVDDELELEAAAFVWGLALDLDGEAAIADNCIDLLPGIPYRIPWPAGSLEPRILATGNRFFAPAP